MSTSFAEHLRDYNEKVENIHDRYNELVTIGERNFKALDALGQRYLQLIDQPGCETRYVILLDQVVTNMIKQTPESGPGYPVAPINVYRLPEGIKEAIGRLHNLDLLGRRLDDNRYIPQSEYSKLSIDDELELYMKIKKIRPLGERLIHISYNER